MDDKRLDLFLDDQPLGYGSLRQGINISTYTTIGTHLLEVRPLGIRPVTREILEFPRPGSYTVRWRRERFGKAEFLATNADLGTDLSRGMEELSTAHGTENVGFFSCKVPLIAPLGFAERVFSYPFLLGFMFRKALVKIRSNQLTLQVASSSNDWYDVTKISVSEFVSATSRVVPQREKLHWVFTRTIKALWLYALMMMAYFLAYLLFGGYKHGELEAIPPIIGLFLAGSAGMAFVFVLVPGFFITMKELTHLVFHTKHQKEFGVFLNPDQMATALQVLKELNLDLRTIDASIDKE